jgi:phosphatidylserine/phosphatidylglycerophosphate/cardiolipin synthase-like enzyme
VNELVGVLSTHDLRALAVALRGGKLTAPFTELSVRRFVGSAVSAAATEMLRRFGEAGASPAAIGLMLEQIARDRERRASADDAIDLVSTGPETAAVPNRDTRVVVSELFSAACTSVTLVGYAVYGGKQVFRSLAERMEQLPELDVRMYLDVQRKHLDTTRPEELVRRFAHRFRTEEWPGTRLPRVFYDPRSVLLDNAQRASLHAKCIVVDRRTSFISSANFTGPAQLKNIEIGVVIRSRSLAERLEDHFDALARTGALQSLALQ